MMRTFFFLLLSLVASQIVAQTSPDQILKLEDLSDFKTQAGNWSIVGKVLMNPEIDIHEPPPPPIVEAKAKKKKRKNKVETPPPPPKPKAVTFEAGTGILLNWNNDSNKDHLLTNWEHGDLLLDLEVMIPKGSNSGIYLQGRYEVQLLDSWGVADPSYSDIGGIYRNWESEPGMIYMGKAPITNAAKAPGLWQHFSIAFKAPRFDKQGRKIANARFIYVDLNGIRIHENLEVPLPTGGPVENNEVAKGPLMIQGDHGPVALRNIRYQLLEEKAVDLKAISYAYFPGPVADFAALEGMEPSAQGNLPELSVQAGQPTDQFGMILKGNMLAPAAGDYALRLNYNGNARLLLGDQVIEGNYRIGGEQHFTAKLSAGENPFTIQYYKSDTWFDAGLGLFEVGAFPRPLHAYDSYPSTRRQAAPIYVEVGAQPRLLRAFLDFDGDRKQRLTHTIGVGSPGGTHFIYDLKAGNPVCVWRGEFINATPMWNSRGDGSFRPRGAVQYLFTGSSFALLDSRTADFPAILNSTGDFTNKGYRIDPETGMPVFLYTRDTLELEDMILPDDSGHALIRAIRFIKGTDSGDLYAKLAAGDHIELLPSGIFVIDQEYYVKINSGHQVTIRSHKGKQELISPLAGADLSYTINW